MLPFEFRDTVQYADISSITVRLLVNTIDIAQLSDLAITTVGMFVSSNELHTISVYQHFNTVVV